MMINIIINKYSELQDSIRGPYMDWRTGDGLLEEESLKVESEGRISVSKGNQGWAGAGKGIFFL